MSGNSDLGVIKQMERGETKDPQCGNIIRSYLIVRYHLKRRDNFLAVHFNAYYNAVSTQNEITRVVISR